MEAKAVNALVTFAAGVLLARTEGIIAAPETNHAIACVIDEAQKAKEEGKEKVIIYNLSGHGLIDLGAYDKYLSGQLENIALDEAAIVESEKILEQYPKPQLLKSR